jgi:dihydrolipoamide dehydrogenase
VRKLKTEAQNHGVIVGDVKVDFPKMVARSRAIAEKLRNGVASLFRKYEVKSEVGTGRLVGPHKVEVQTKDGKREFTRRAHYPGHGGTGDTDAGSGV